MSGQVKQMGARKDGGKEIEAVSHLGLATDWPYGTSVVPVAGGTIVARGPKTGYIVVFF
jgi:hypothetical protein